MASRSVLLLALVNSSSVASELCTKGHSFNATLGNEIQKAAHYGRDTSQVAKITASSLTSLLAMDQ